MKDTILEHEHMHLDQQSRHAASSPMTAQDQRVQGKVKTTTAREEGEDINFILIISNIF